MSHIVECKVKFNNAGALERAIQHALTSGLLVSDLGLGQHKVYSRTVEGRGLRLDGWLHPVVIDENGLAAYDNYNGAWGSQIGLDRFTQRYAAEAVKLEAEMQGLSYMETTTENGAIDLEVACV